MPDAKVSALTEISTPSLTDYEYAVQASGPTSGRLTYTRLGGLLVPAMATGRLTLTTGNAVPTADVTSGATLYYTDIHNDGTVTSSPFQISIFDGTRLRMYSSAQISLTLTGLLTNARPHDVFIYDNAGTLTLEVLAWTSDTARVALAPQSGTLVKTGATTRRFIGTIYATGTGTTADSVLTRYVSNVYNRVPRALTTGAITGASHTYASATWREWNAGTSVTRLNWVDAIAGQTPVLNFFADTTGGGGGSNAYYSVYVDATSGDPSESVGNNVALQMRLGGSKLSAAGILAAGKHYATMAEYAEGGTRTFTNYWLSGVVVS